MSQEDIYKYKIMYVWLNNIPKVIVIWYEVFDHPSANIASWIYNPCDFEKQNLSKKQTIEHIIRENRVKEGF